VLAGTSLYVSSNSPFDSRSIITDSPSQKASQTIISPGTVCYTIHTDLGVAFLMSFTGAFLARSLRSDVDNDFIAHF
jgi:hypothetical protein